MPTSALRTPATRPPYSGRASDRRARPNPLERALARRDRAEVQRTPLLQKDNVDIWLADSNDDDEVDTLVHRMYRQRGYLVETHRAHGASSIRRVTLEARHAGSVVGTLTVNLGGSCGLSAEELYAEEIRPYRERGARVCELTRLALDSESCNKQILGCLFHIGFAFAFRIYEASDMFIEVNPRHALFYRRKLNFEPVGGEKLCPRVRAPAVLLHKDLHLFARELWRFGGCRAPENKAFYAFMLTPGEERISVQKMRQLVASGGCRAGDADALSADRARSA